MLSSKSLVIGLIIGIFVGLLTGFFMSQILSSQFSEITNPKIICYAEEGGTSGWYKTENCPVLSSYDAGAENFSSLPDLSLGVYVRNNNSISLFNVEFEVSYRTSENKWNTTPKINIGLLDVEQIKQTRFTLTNPYLSLWQTKRAVYNNPDTHWENVTVYFLDSSDYKITAYGFAKP